MTNARASAHEFLFKSRLPPTPEIVELDHISGKQTILVAALWLFVGGFSAMLLFDWQGTLTEKFNADQGERAAFDEINSVPVTKRRILVVEDDPDFRDMVAEALESRGHEVVRAECGRQAVELLKLNRFDAVISDVLMPDGDGMSLLDMIASKPQHPPVYLMTGIDVTETEARERGAAGVLSKPFRSRDLISRLAV
jgi:two-component system, cell cycle response regulator CpdR